MVLRLPEALEFVYFLHRPKSNKNASTTKNSLGYLFIFSAFMFAFRLVFHFPISFINHYKIVP